MLFTPLAEKPAAIHLTGTSWVHDDVIAQNTLQSTGLRVFFDAPLKAPAGDSGSALMDVSLELPLPLSRIHPDADAAARFRLSAPLSGDVSLAAPNVLAWKPAQAGAELAGLASLLIGQDIEQVRLRVALRGSMIWSEQPGGQLYLDGRVYGRAGLRADGSPRIELAFPSGDGQRSSDFESWLYLRLQIAPPKLTQVRLPPKSSTPAARRAAPLS